MTNDKTTVRFAYVATNGETTRARDFDGVETITVPTARLRELYAELARLERQVEADALAQFTRLEEMAYALDSGNTERQAIPADVLAAWLHYVCTGEQKAAECVPTDDVARLERQVEAAEAIMREVGSKVSPRLVEAWREAGR